MTPAERTMVRVIVDEAGCWNFTGALRNGYGVVGLGGKAAGLGYCHRVMYAHLIGPIPDGMDLDHLCLNRRCCNPEHVEPVTRSENVRRELARRWAEPRTHCSNGHEYTANDVRTSGGHRCNACRREAYARSKAMA